MTLLSKMLGFSAFLMLISAILFVILGQITVKKLRKNPDVKDHLGVEFSSGWDILNVAGCLSTPAWLRKRFSESRLSFLSANYQIVFENTNKFDRVLARVFWFFYVTSCSLMIILVSANGIGILE